jgi:hypothetical protein
MALVETLIERPVESGEVDIKSALGGIVEADSRHEADQLFYQVIDTALTRDLQYGYITELDFRKGKLVEEITADPRESIIEKATELQRLYAGRSIIEESDGRRYTHFATRNASRDDVDLVFRMTEEGEDRPWLSIETRLQGQLETPCRIVATDETVRVTQKTYRGGGWHDVDIASVSEERADAMLKAVAADMFWATTWNYERGPEERNAIDSKALRLLVGHIALTRSV